MWMNLIWDKDGTVKRINTDSFVFASESIKEATDRISLLYELNEGVEFSKISYEFRKR